MSNILAINTTADNSADFTVAAGTPKTICLTSTAGLVIEFGALVHLQYKDAAGKYINVDRLTSARPATMVVGPGTYRVVREAGVSCGVDLT